jgi:molecular chaperone DnaJ
VAVDHYEVLGVSRDASDDDIRRAYRKLARQLHPDVNQDDGAEDKFKLVTHAYEVLSDPDQRARYDRGGDSLGGFGPFGDIFETFFGGGQHTRGPRSRSERGQDALIRVEVELADVLFGVTKTIEVDTAVLCEACQGSCCAPGSEPQLCDICRGTGQIQRTVRSVLGNMITQSPCGSCRGFGSIIPNPCPTCVGQGRVRATRSIDVEIPGGIETGQRIHLPGSGEVGHGGGPAGDLYLEFTVRQHSIFQRVGDDLVATIEVDMTDALVGTAVTLDALDGPVDVDIRPGVQNDDTLTFKSRGVSKLRGAGRGDLALHVHITTPTKLSQKETELITALRTLRSPEAPHLRDVGPKKFQRLRERFFGG